MRALRKLYTPSLINTESRHRAKAITYPSSDGYYSANVHSRRHTPATQEDCFLQEHRDNIKNIFSEWSSKRENKGHARPRGWAAEIHTNNLREIHEKTNLEKLKPANICLSCLSHPPQHALECGHVICDVCVRALTEPDPAQEYSYMLEMCIFCRTPSSLRVVLKPPTAGTRTIVLDGGGCRGVVELAKLKHLQEKLDEAGAGQVRDYFDLAFGTSAGM